MQVIKSFMSKEPAILLLVSFEDENIADKAFFDLKMDKRGRLIEFKDAAIVNRDAQDKLHIKETADLSGGKGMLYGGVIGALIGLIAGPVGAAIGGVAGILLGVFFARKFDAGIPDDRLTQIGAALQPGSSVILAVVEQRWLEPVRSRLEEAGGEFLSEPIKAEYFDQVESGREDA